ncbi:MAG: DUF3014 domain-containing protein [Candidatus Aminicenantaceae bacterium]
MRDYKKVLWLAIIIIAVIGIGFGIYYFFFYEKPQEPLMFEEVVEEEPSDTPEEKPEREDANKVIKWDKVSLDKSDDLIRSLAAKLSSHPQFIDWLKNEDIIRKFSAVVDSIAHGQAPRKFVDFLTPKESFKVIKIGESYYLDPVSYERYNLAADVFASLDTEECLKLYWELKPLIQKAYIDLGYPTDDFHDTLLKAIVELLKTPVIEGDIPLEKEVVTYKMADPKLEQLSPPQKHLLRMGAPNVQKIQAKLLELAQALEFDKSQLPQSEIYIPLQ